MSDRGKMRQAFLALPDDVRETMEFVYVRRKPIAKAAEALGVTRQEVADRRDDGLAWLRDNVPPIQTPAFPTTPSDRLQLDRWTLEGIHAEARAEHGAYLNELKSRWRAWFAGPPPRPKRHAGDAYVSAELKDAFPVEYAGHADLPIKWHRHARSAPSSQVLAVTLLKPVLECEGVESVAAIGKPLPALGQLIGFEFEYSVGAALLGEGRAPTQVDLYLEGSERIILVESKFTEKDFACSCPGRDIGLCSPPILERTEYWEEAATFFGIGDRPSSYGPCAFGTLAYQVVRNLAAARRLAEGRAAVVALVYDARNPYHAGACRWPGWADVISSTVAAADGDVEFRAVSWQRLLAEAAIPKPAAEWAREKHGLEPAA